jgi:hypothetical protein
MFRGNRVGFFDTDDEDDMMTIDSSRMSLSELMTELMTELMPSGIHVIEDDE